MIEDAMSVLLTRPFAQGAWSAARRLVDWQQCPACEGLYAVGIPHPAGATIGPPIHNQGLLGGLPEHFDVVYIGKSLEQRTGIRGRLGKHFRGRRGGNRCIGMHVRAGVEFCIAFLRASIPLHSRRCTCISFRSCAHGSTSEANSSVT